MNLSTLTVSLMFVLGSTAFAGASDSEGSRLFAAKCSTCHKIEFPKDLSTLTAPPALGITMHVKHAHPDLKSFTEFVVDYVQFPDRGKSLCEEKTVKRFGVMPSQKGNVSPKELEKIAHYLYANFAQGNFEREHKKIEQRLRKATQRHFD